MKRSLSHRLEKGDLLPALLILPALLLVFCIIIIPMCYGLIVSLFDYNLGDTLSAENFVGLGNYIRAFQDRTVWKALLNTLLFAVGCIAGDLFFGTVIAILLYRLRESVSRILRPFVIMPLLVAPVVASLMWSYFFDANGIIYWLLEFVGVTYADFPGISGTGTALLCCIIVHWWQSVPFVVIVLTAGLLSISNDLYEAAQCDGINLIQTLWHITLPLLKSVYITIFLITGVDTIKSLDIIYALTKGGPNNASMTLNLYAYQQAFSYVDMSYSMALAIITMVVALVCCGLPYVRYTMRKSEEGSV
ncbi:MAG TPA: sugar ABC transporter permease [Candidatus Onthomonas avicola]|nr:sugar ABC transporter permease [Candidatus Onthomonas avicola]